MTDPTGFNDRVAAAWPPAAWQDVTVVVGISGGADSTALLSALAALKTSGAGRLVAAHFHHGIRGAAADADAQFALELGRRFGVACELGRAEGPGEGRPASEAALRLARHRFLRNVAHRVGARYVALAHTADDQVETILHRVLRGTGIPGLAGMPRVRRLSHAVTLIRPLLDLTRREVLDYLTSGELQFREDASNSDLRYTRNRIRHRLLPWLEDEFNPCVRQAVGRLGRLAVDAQQVLDWTTDQMLAGVLVSRTDRSVTLQTAPLCDAPATVGRALFVRLWSAQQWPAREMDLAQWSRLTDFAREPLARGPDRLDLPGGVCAQKTTGGQLVLTAGCGNGER